MARSHLTAAFLMLAGLTTAGMFGCDTSQPANSGVRSTYGNIEITEDWNQVKQRPAPAPKPAPAPVAHNAPPPPPPPPPPAAGGACLFLPTGDRATSALSLCCRMPGEVTAGQNFTYDIEVCNLTGMTLNSVNVTYTLDGARVVSSDPAMQGNGFGVGDLGPRQCKTIKVTASAASVGTIKGCMSATWMNAICCTTNVVQPALKLVKDVNPKDVNPCGTVTYTLTVTNTGTGAANNVKIMDDLPSGVTSDNKSSLGWDIGTLGAGQSRTVTFVAKPGKSGSYANHARATADNNLTATSNDVSFAVHAAQLQVTKACPDRVFIGRPSQFKITVSNKGDGPAMNVRVDDTAPQGLTFTSASDGGQFSNGHVMWNLGTLAPGASKDLTVNFSGGALGKLENRVSVMADCAETVSAACSTNYEGVADIGTSIIDDTGVVPLGDEHVFHYRVRNQGQIDLTNVVMTAELDPGLDFKRSTFQGAQAAGQRVTFTVGTLKVGQEVLIDIICTGSKTGELVIRTTTKADKTHDVRNDEQVNYVER